MSSSIKETRECGVLTLTGENRIHMLRNTASLALRHEVNIAECIGHTLADKVVLFAKLEGSRDDLDKLKGDLPEAFPGLVTHFSVTDDVDCPIPKMGPFPWRLHISCPDLKGILFAITSFLTEKGIHIMSYRLERYLPNRSCGQQAAVQTFTIRTPEGFSRKEFLGELQDIADKHNFFSAVLDPL